MQKTSWFLQILYGVFSRNAQYRILYSLQTYIYTHKLFDGLPELYIWFRQAFQITHEETSFCVICALLLRNSSSRAYFSPLLEPTLKAAPSAHTETVPDRWTGTGGYWCNQWNDRIARRLTCIVFTPFSYSSVSTATQKFRQNFFVLFTRSYYAIPRLALASALLNPL